MSALGKSAIQLTKASGSDAEGQPELAALEARVVLLQQVLDTLGVGIVVVGENSSVLFANRSGEAVLRQRDGIWIGGGGRLTVEGRPGRALAAALRRSPASPGPFEAGDSEPLLIDRTQGKPLAALIVPLEAQPNDAPATAILLPGPEPDYRHVSRIIGREHGLTAAEQSMLAALAEGLPLLTVAARQGVSLTTVKTQLCAVLAKTGCRRQQDLARLVHRHVAALVAAAAPKNPPATRPHR